MKKTILSLSALAMVLALSFTACKKDEEMPAPAAAPTLYERVGGTKLMADPANPGQQIETGRFTLRAVVDTAILVIAGDPKMTKFFPTLFAELGANNTTGLTALSKNLTDFLGFATGSKTIKYGGKSMLAAHNNATNSRMGQPSDPTSVKADNADMTNFINDVGVSLGKNGVTDTKLINDLVALLETTRKDIVQK